MIQLLEHVGGVMQGPQGNATSASWAAMLPALRFGS